MNAHPGTALPLAQAVTTFPPYRSTFPFAGETLSPAHRTLADAAAQQGILMRLRKPGRLVAGASSAPARWSR